MLADQYASRFGVSKYAIIGAVANEYDARYAYSVLDGRGAYLQALTDQLASWRNTSSSAIEDYYIKYQFDMNAGVDVNSGSYKLFNPAATDIGPGNIRISTAIALVQSVYADEIRTGADSSGLARYNGHYDNLVSDLLNFDNPAASYQFAAAYLKQGESFFRGKSDAAWQQLTPAQQEALLVTYYKVGPKLLSVTIDQRLAEAAQTGATFTFNPNGDGGCPAPHKS